MGSLRLLARYFAASMRAQMQYPASSVMLAVGAFALTIIDILAVWARATQLIIMGVVQEQAGDIKYRILILDQSGGNILFIVRPQQRVELTAGAVTVIGARDHVEPGDPLTCLS